MITIASVAFAVVTAILLRSLQKGVFLHLIDNIVSYHTGYIQIHRKGYQAEPILKNSFEGNNSLLQQWKSIEGIRAIVPRFESFLLASSNEHTKGCLLTGIDIAAEKSITEIDQKIIAGRYFNNSEKGVLISEGLAQKLGITIKDTLILLGQGYEGSLAAGKFPVIGLLHFPTPSMNTSMLYLPLEHAQELFNAPGRLTALTIQLNRPENLQFVADVLEKQTGQTYEVVTWKEMLPDIEDHFRTDTIFFYIEISILYIVIAFGLFGTLLMMTHERKYENGMLLAIGMKKWQIGTVLFGETIMLGMTGAVAGMLLSLPIVYYLYIQPIRFTGEFARIYTQFGFEPIFPAILDISVFSTQAMIVFSMTAILGLFPFFSILQMNPLKSMKSN